MMKPIVLLICTLLLAFGSVSGQSLLKQEFHDNGRLSKTVFAEKGNIHFIFYHANGKVAEIGSYRNGVRSGVWKTFDHSGSLVSQGHFHDDLRVGPWSFRSEFGQGYGQIIYKDGKLVDGKHWSNAGELISSID
jgi:antitoxin component YwqK of YwqJK toxin-antitoxin module